MCDLNSFYCFVAEAVQCIDIGEILSKYLILHVRVGTCVCVRARARETIYSTTAPIPSGGITATGPASIVDANTSGIARKASSPSCDVPFGLRHDLSTRSSTFLMKRASESERKGGPSRGARRSGDRRGGGGGRGRMNKEWKEREGRKRTRRWGWRVRDS
jgi:hypothetical protein